MAPAIAPSTPDPPNSFAALKPTRIGRYANSAHPMVRMHSYHHMPDRVPPVETLMTLQIPLINPAAMIPGSRATKIFAIFFRKRCTGLSCLAFCFALFSAVTADTSSFFFGAAPGSSATPLAMPVNPQNASRTLFTFPGPKTICRVSLSTTPRTPSSFLTPSKSTLSIFLIPTRSLVMHAALEDTFSMPPRSTRSSFAVCL